ncbi:MAG: hypothetical protein ABSG68_15700 [Thermoguttaceae bacterium]
MNVGPKTACGGNARERACKPISRNAKQAVNSGGGMVLDALKSVLIHFRLHIHSIAPDGAFAPDGTFVCLPKTSAELLLATWQDKVFDLLVAAEKIDRETVEQMRSWPHSGFRGTSGSGTSGSDFNS